MEFELKGDFIELDNLLKNLKLVASGVDARERILAGQVKVNTQVESRIRRKLRLEDTVEFDGKEIKIVKAN